MLLVKNMHANAGDVRNVGSAPGLGKSPRGGHDNYFQYTCLENPMGRGACPLISTETDMNEVT